MKARKPLIVALFLILAAASASLALFSVTLAIALIAGLVVIAAVFINPFYGIILYVILLYIRPQEFIPSLAKMRIILVVAVIVLTFYLIHKIFRKERIGFFTTRQHKLMFLLLLLVPVSNLANLRLAAAWEGFTEFLKFFLLFFIIVNIADDLGKFVKTAKILVISTLLLAVNGIVQHYRGVDLLGNPLVANRIRWVGVFGNPNDLALVINSLFPFVLVNIFEGDVSRPKKGILLGVAAIFIAAIYFTDSRGGFLALLAILVLFSFKRWGALKGVALCSILIIAASLLTPNRMVDLSPYGDSASGRIYAWIDGLVMLKSHPIFGVGFKNFTLFQNRAAHSAFVECFAELGLIGYFVWLSLVYTSFSDLMAVEKAGSSRQHAKNAWILQLSLAGFLVSAFFLSQTYSPVLYTLLAFSVIVSHDPLLNTRRPRFLSRNEVAVTAAIIGFSILLYKVLATVYI